MRVLIINPIIYTNETRNIKKVNTIKDTMIYDLCLGFIEAGIDVTLGASDLYKPIEKEEYPFEVRWLKTKCTSLFTPHNFPYCPEVKKLAKEGNYDLIISSEVFSINSLMLSIHSKNNLIVWQELGKHNKIFKGYASRFWYGVVARLFFKDTLIVPRSENAKNFISKYCNNTTKEIIDHGVNLDKFLPQDNKENYFVVSSQLIKRKHIEKIIVAFNEFIKNYSPTSKLIIMGDGDQRKALENQVSNLGIEKSVEFTGKLNHNELIKRLAKAKAMLVYTEKDNNMISIIESIAVGTPVITTSVPYNSSYIKSDKLGIVKDNWNENDLKEISDNKEYISNCLNYRATLSTIRKAKAFVEIKEKYLNKWA